MGRIIFAVAVAALAAACSAPTGKRGFEIAADPAFMAAYPSLAVGDLMDVSGPAVDVDGITVVSGCRPHLCPYEASFLAFDGKGSGMLAKTVDGRPGVAVETVGGWVAGVPAGVGEAYGKWLEGLSPVQSPLPTPR